LKQLVQAGNTVVVIEHHLDVIYCADWVIDLGPEGGPEGGEIIASGSPEAVAREPRSHTGRCLAELIARREGESAKPRASGKPKKAPARKNGLRAAV
jgi:excinuclease ABC subunit A